MKKIVFAILVIPILLYITYRKCEFAMTWLSGEPKDKSSKLKDFYNKITRKK